MSRIFNFFKIHFWMVVLFISFLLFLSAGSSARAQYPSSGPGYCDPDCDLEGATDACGGGCSGDISWSSTCVWDGEYVCAYTCYECLTNPVCTGAYTDCGQCDETYGTMACFCTTDVTLYQITACDNPPSGGGGGGYCGDGTCYGAETCGNCAVDCGACACTNVAPSTPIYYSPANNSSVSLSNGFVTFDWSDVNWGRACSNSQTTYALYLLDEERYLNHATYFGGTSFPNWTYRNSYTAYLQTTNGTSTISTNAIDLEETYYWLIRAYNGVLLADGATWRFTVAGCGDSVCSGFETCSSCPQDCGVCQSAWWQTWGGHAYSALTSGNAINSLVASTCVEPNCAALMRLDRAGVSLSDGLPITGGGSIETNGQAITSRTPDTYGIDSQTTRLSENFAYFTRQYSLGLSPTSDFPGSTADALKPTYDSQVTHYYHQGDLTIQSAWSVASGENYVIFVDGNLLIEDPTGVGELVQVAPGGFLAFIVSGNIEIDQSVGHSTLSNTSGNVEGIYVSDGVLTIETNGGSDERFIGEGSFVGWGGVNLERDLVVGNQNYPAETFVFRPDLVVNTPDEMKRSQMLWQETN